MPSFKDTRQLPYEAELINNIVLDIEKYPEFLPWCSNAKIISKSEKEIIAEMLVGLNVLQECYTSRVTANKTLEGFTINVEAISGPFKKLINFWDIKRKNNYCEVNFSIDFEFKSAILGAVMETFFSIATNKMINAFEARALYLSTLQKS